MGRGGRTGIKPRSDLRVRKKSVDSEGSDEDYVAEADEVDDQSDELDSLVREASDEESEFNVEDEEDEEEEEEGGADNGWRTVVKPKPKPKPKPRLQKRSARSKRNGINRPKKRRKATFNDNDDSDEDDDDDDDDEFTPDEVDYFEEEEEEEEELEEEEEELEEEEDYFRPVKAKTKKKGRTVLKRKRSVRGPKRKKRAKTARKPSKKKTKRSRRLRTTKSEDDEEDDEDFIEEGPTLRDSKKKTNRSRRLRTTKSEDDEDFIEEGPTLRDSKKKTKRSGRLRKTKSEDDEDFIEECATLRDRTKRKSESRNKRVRTGSDSEFCFDSSDCEFTISEEEREQIREANEICRTLATNLRSSKKNQEEQALCEPKKPPARKGKEKAEEPKNDVGKPVCGICLTEEGKSTVRGTLNCCSHFFCFACIMEWSKVETRCPLCKQRFVTISKPTRCGKGFDLRNAVVPVPERDQVYQPSEEELRDFLNPYENVICTECHQGGDDALMLLCDVCDSPAHTYCVGLGREVPEGNWYCDGCRPAALASLQSLTQDYTPDQRAGAGASHGQSYENMAEIDLNVTIPETPVSQGAGFLPSPRFSSGNYQAPSPVSGLGVSTVSGRRRIHHQIRSILSNRLSQTGGDRSSLGYLMGLGANTSSHHSRTHVGTSHHAQQVDRFQEFDPPSVQNTDFVPGRTGNMMGQIGQRSAAVDGSAHGLLHWSGLNRINVVASQPQLSASGELHPCSSRSSMVHDIGAFPSVNRDGEHSSYVKQQIYSTVRDQLKSLSREMYLDHNMHTEISRRSANAIMAAYGLEPRRHDTLEVRHPICFHPDNRLPGPLTNSCLGCFQQFVKDVVKGVMDIVVAPNWLGFR